MKKNLWTKMVSLVLALVCVASLVACGGGGNTEAAGTYKLQSMEMAGMSMGPELLDPFNINLILNEDGSFKLDMDAIDATLSAEGTWSGSSSKITLTVDGSKETASLKDGEITLEETEDGQTISMTFVKQ